MTDELSDIIPTLDSFPEFTDIENPRFVNEGGYGSVYVLNEKKRVAGKILFADNAIKARSRIIELQKEESYSRALWENGVSVPQPFGIYRLSARTSLDLNTEEWFGSPTPAVFVQEYIDGIVKEEEFTAAQREKALKLRDQELEKARLLGFEPVDIDFENFIYQPKKERVVLIDFALWERR